MDVNLLSVAEVIDRLGGTGEVARRYGVTAPAVSNWKAANEFPPRLHLRVYRDCIEAGITFDPALPAKGLAIQAPRETPGAAA